MLEQEVQQTKQAGTHMFQYINSEYVQRNRPRNGVDSFFPQGLLEWSITLGIIIFFVIAFHQYSMHEKEHKTLKDKLKGKK